MYASYELIFLTKDGELLNVMPRIREEVLIRLTELTGYQLAGYPSNKWEVVKWPDYVSHIKQISRVFNDIVFLLNREGETPGDLRKEYFYSGVHCSDVARIGFNDLGESISELLQAHEKQSKLRDDVIPILDFEKLKEVASG